MYNSGLGYIGEDTGFDPGALGPSTWAPSAPTVESNPWIYDTSGGGTDWGSFILGAMKLVPNIIASGKGNPYGQAGASGQQGGSSGFSLQGQSSLGGGSLGISSTTLLLIGAVALIFFMKK